MRETVKDWKNTVIGMVGSHTARQIAPSAKRWGFETLIIMEKGRDELYTKFNSWLFDEAIVVDSFRDVLDNEFQSILREKNVILVPNRSFAVYVGPEEIKKKFHAPLFGSRELLPIEDRANLRGQYYLLDKAGIPMPMTFSSPEEIDRLVIVKLPQAKTHLKELIFTLCHRKISRKKLTRGLRSG